MNKLIHWLKRDFVLVDLGAASAVDNPVLRPLYPSLTLVELDAANDSQVIQGSYFRHARIRGGAAGQTGPRPFTLRSFPNTSSVLEPRPELVKAYGLEPFFQPVRQMTLDCTSLPDMLDQLDLQRVDFLKTDLEGMDTEVLLASASILEKTLVVQCELRFQPFYQGEPTLFEAGHQLERAGFECVWMTPEIWKYPTDGRDVQRDGRWVFADVVFFKTPEEIQRIFGPEANKALAKQVILACALGHPNFAGYVLDLLRKDLDPELTHELDDLIRNSQTSARFHRFCAWLSRSNAGQRLLNVMRKAGRKLQQGATVYDPLKHVGGL